MLLLGLNFLHCTPLGDFIRSFHISDTEVIRCLGFQLLDDQFGLLLAKLPDLDAISMGPNIYHIHTTKERLDIASVQRTWELLLSVLGMKD